MSKWFNECNHHRYRHHHHFIADSCDGRKFSFHHLLFNRCVRSTKIQNRKGERVNEKEKEGHIYILMWLELWGMIRAYKQHTVGYNAIERDADDDSKNCDAYSWVKRRMIRENRIYFIYNMSLYRVVSHGSYNSSSIIIINEPYCWTRAILYVAKNICMLFVFSISMAFARSCCFGWCHSGK